MKNKQGLYKDFLHLGVAWSMQYGGGAVKDAITSASIVSGLKGLSAKEQRDIMYSTDSEWTQVINLLSK